MSNKNLRGVSEVRLKKLDSFTFGTSKNHLIRIFLRNGRLRLKIYQKYIKLILSDHSWDFYVIISLLRNRSWGARPQNVGHYEKTETLSPDWSLRNLRNSKTPNLGLVFFMLRTAIIEYSYNLQIYFNPKAPVAQKIADEVVCRRFQGDGVEFF